MKLKTRTLIAIALILFGFIGFLFLQTQSWAPKYWSKDQIIEIIKEYEETNK